MRSLLRRSLSAVVALTTVGLVLFPSGSFEAALAQATGYLQTFDGNPPAPKPFEPDGWDFTIVGDPQPMQAQHGADCSAPPATHPISTLQDMVFQCKGHLMTAINAGYGTIYMTPNQQLDFSQGEAVLKWDMSTLRTSARDWVDIVIMPFNENMQLSFENFDVHIPQDAVRLELGGSNVFLPSVWRNGRKQDVSSDVATTWDMIFARAGLHEDAARRDTFELHLSRTHIKFGMPAYNFWWVDTDIAPLNWDQGVVQLDHRTYNPDKACDFDGSCGPDTWHWDNISLDPALPFTIQRADRRLVNSDSAAQPVTFATPAPQNAFLRFVGIGLPIQVSFDGGQTWQDAPTQGQTMGTAHPEIPDNFWMPLPAGTQSVLFRGQRHSTIPWEVSDISYWVAAPGQSSPAPAVAQSLTAAQPTPTPAPQASTTTTTNTASPGTITFDDLPSPDRGLDGQYPSGVIDWGTGAWWLAKPWGQFSTNSISFNGDGPTSGTFNLLAPRVLTQLDADNGGAVDAEISLSCDGQPPVSMTVPAGQVVTLHTGWSSPCSTVTITSSNGWNTNFDNLVLQ